MMKQAYAYQEETPDGKKQTRKKKLYIWQHFKTITSHKILVTQYCFRIGLFRQGLMHDLSKYSWTEFSEGCRYWQGTRSPNNAEREATGVSLSWLHHKGRNRHHFEYWIDYGIRCDTVICGVPIPRKYIAEMIMDRISASKVYLGRKYTDKAPLEYWRGGKDKLWFVHDEVKRQLDFLLGMLAKDGEKKTLAYIRNVYLKEKNSLHGPKECEAEGKRKLRDRQSGKNPLKSESVEEI